MKRILFFVIINIILVNLIFSQQKYEPGVILLKFKKPEVISIDQNRVINGGSQINSVLGKYRMNKSIKLSHVDYNTDGCYRLEFPLNINIEEIQSALSKCPEIEFVTLNYYGEYCDTPNDTYWNYQWAIQKMEVPNAWNITKPNGNILVGIIDGGLNVSHADLSDNIWTNPGEIPNNDVDDDGNGLIDDIHGWDFVYSNNDLSDPYPYHGTRIAGVIGAKANNSIGMAGIAGGWQNQSGVKLIGLGNGYVDYYGNVIPQQQASAQAINYLTSLRQQGYIVIANMSFSSTNDWPLLATAISSANNAGMIMVAAAGNGSPLNPLTLPTPAKLDSVLAIGASKYGETLAQEVRSYYSKYDNEEKLLVVAPVDSFMLQGDRIDVCTTYPNPANSYVNWFSGTSAACPMAVGVVALMLSINSNLTYLQISNIFEKTAEKIGNYNYVGGRALEVGYGRINAYKALKYTLENYGGTLTQSITIPSDETWTISPGITWKFSSGTGITVNGTLNASGTSANPITFTSTNSGSTWSGIVISGSGAGGSVLSHCIIEKVLTYGGAVVSLNNVSGNPIIEYTKIQNCANYGTSAISVSNSNGYLTRNLLDNNSYGVNCSNYSSPNLGRYSDNSCSNGNNTITNNGYGVTANNSSPYMGSQGNTSVEYNHITSNSTYNLYASGSSYINAENDYWGSGTPSGISAVNGATISYQPYLTCAPVTVFKINQIGTGSKIPFVATNENKIDLNDLLKQAKDNQFNKKYDEAVKIYKSIISSSPDAKESLFSLSGLLSVYRDNSDPEILKSIDKLQKKDGDFDATSKMALANGYVIAERTDDALNMLQDIVKKYKQTDYEKNALMQIAIINFFNKKDEKTANLILEDLDSRYKDDKDVAMVKWLVKGRGSNNQNNFDRGTTNNPNKNLTDSLNIKKTSYENDLIQNFPNPFNPSTTITYSIPKDGQVKLVVYDILGKEVKTLVNEVKPVGSYSVQFDANKLSSGNYYCRIFITPANGEKMIVQQKQMQVLK